MDLRAQLLKDHSKSNCERIVKWIGCRQDRFNELFQLFLNDDYRVVQRAAWPMSLAVIKHPELIRPHFGKLIRNLQKPDLHDAVKRNTVRLLQDIPIPKRYHGLIMHTCFEFINSPTEAIAVKAFSLTILDNLAIQYPEINFELKIIIEERWNHESTAFKSRGKKILGRIAG